MAELPAFDREGIGRHAHHRPGRRDQLGQRGDQAVPGRGQTALFQLLQNFLDVQGSGSLGKYVNGIAGAGQRGVLAPWFGACWQGLWFLGSANALDLQPPGRKAASSTDSTSSPAKPVAGLDMGDLLDQR